jgi:hypothetical protein
LYSTMNAGTRSSFSGSVEILYTQNWSARGRLVTLGLDTGLFGRLDASSLRLLSIRRGERRRPRSDISIERIFPLRASSGLSVFEWFSNWTEPLRSNFPEVSRHWICAQSSATQAPPLWCVGNGGYRVQSPPFVGE